MTTDDLIDMMFEDEPIETFANILEENNPELGWEELLEMCYWEKSYASVGGDQGYKKNPPINYKRIEYLGKLITFLESKGIAVEKATWPRIDTSL